MSLEPGASFAGFQVVRRLGAGGMGEVYLVEHPRLPRQEALKVLSETYSDNQEYRARFQREAELAASLWHPHLVGLHDRGEDDDGRLWISMDYIDGSDMARLLKTKYPGGMPVNEALPAITAIASALDYAHSRGMLHRDVKPSNILVSEGDFHEQRIALADFGIARAMDDMAGLTGTNFALGTVEYAAPEQLRGWAIDARADQYALAATAFQLLTGSPPFPGSSAVEVISQHLTDAPPSLGATKPELGAVDGVFARAMAKDPAMRFNTCGEFASSLEAAARAAPPAPAGPPVDAAVPYPPSGPVPAMPPTMPAHAYNENFHRAPTQAAAVSKNSPAQGPVQQRRRRITSPIGIALLAATVALLAVALWGAGMALFGYRGGGPPPPAPRTVPPPSSTVAVPPSSTVDPSSAPESGGSVSARALESELRGKLSTAGSPPQRVNCGSDLPAVVGGTASCDVVFSDTNMISAVFTVSDVTPDQKVNYDIAPAMSRQQVGAAVASLSSAQSASCGTGLDGIVGDSTECALTIAGQPPSNRKVKVAAVDPARLGIELSVFMLIPRQQVADTLQQDLSADGSVVGRVDCAQDLPSEVGSTVACTAVTGASSQIYDVMVTQGVGDTVDIDYRAR